MTMHSLKSRLLNCAQAPASAINNATIDSIMKDCFHIFRSDDHDSLIGWGDSRVLRRGSWARLDVSRKQHEELKRIETKRRDILSASNELPALLADAIPFHIIASNAGGAILDFKMTSQDWEACLNRRCASPRVLSSQRCASPQRQQEFIKSACSVGSIVKERLRRKKMSYRERVRDNPISVLRIVRDKLVSNPVVATSGLTVALCEDECLTRAFRGFKRDFTEDEEGEAGHGHTPVSVSSLHLTIYKKAVFIPLRFSPTFGYTKVEKPTHNVGSWFRRLVGGAWWGASLGDVSWERGHGRPYYSSGPSPRGGLGGRLPVGSRWTRLPARV